MPNCSTAKLFQTIPKFHNIYIDNCENKTKTYFRREYTTMSTFQVDLSNSQQGQLDIDPTTGAPFATSKQRTVYIMGPNRVNRELKDGDTFVDSNYYKRFCYPQVPLDQAILTCTVDDGTVWSPVADENVFPVVWNPGTVTAGTITSGSTYTTGASNAPTGLSNYLNILATYGGPATFVQLVNSDSSHDCQVRLNGSTSAVITLHHATTQVFNSNELPITKLEFDNSTSGASSVVGVQVTLGIKSVANS